MALSFSRDFLGCNAKVGAESLMHIIGSKNISVLASDSSPVNIEGFNIFQSIDTVFPFSADIDLFADAAISHCVNDLLCSGKVPVSAMLALAVDDKLTPEESRRLSDAIIFGLDKLGIKLTNCHTYKSSHTSITLGLTSGYSVSIPILSEGGVCVYLTKPLGAATVLHHFGESSGISDLRSITRSNHHGIEGVIRRFGLPYTTDISGYGLLGHLAIVANSQKMQINVFLKDIPIIDLMEKVISDFGPPCSSISNSRFFSEWVSGECGAFPGGMYSLYNGETNGPIMVFVNETHKSHFEDEMKKIGIGCFLVGIGKKADVPMIFLQDTL